MSSAEEQSPISLNTTPLASDPVVQSFHEECERAFLLADLFQVIENIGNANHVAIYATIAEEESFRQPTTIQDLVKEACKTAGLTLDAFSKTADDILEKSRAAYLYIFDGFHDYAENDLDSIRNDVDAFSKNVQMLSKSFENVKEQAEDMESALRSGDLQDKEERLLTVAALRAVSDLVDGICQDLLPPWCRAVECWYSESKELQPQERMTDEERQEYWNSEDFKKHLWMLLCRWKAMSEYFRSPYNEAKLEELTDLLKDKNPSEEPIEDAWRMAETLPFENEVLRSVVENHKAASVVEAIPNGTGNHLTKDRDKASPANPEQESSKKILRQIMEVHLDLDPVTTPCCFQRENPNVRHIESIQEMVQNLHRGRTKSFSPWFDGKPYFGLIDMMRFRDRFSELEESYSQLSDTLDEENEKAVQDLPKALKNFKKCIDKLVKQLVSFRSRIEAEITKDPESELSDLKGLLNKALGLFSGWSGKASECLERLNKLPKDNWVEAVRCCSELAEMITKERIPNTD